MQPLRLHPLTLAFTGEWGLVEKQFRADDFRTALPRIRVSMGLLVVIFGLFAVLDHFVDPESAGAFLLIRFGLITPAALVFYLVSGAKWFKKVYQPLTAFMMVFGASGIMYMMAAGNHAVRASHQTGLFLVIVSLFVFLGLRFIWALAGWIPILIGFLLVNHVHSSSPGELEAVNTFFFMSISVVCFEVCRRHEVSRRRNFALQWSLSLEKAMVAASNRNLETRIDERTRELLHANQVLRDEMTRTEKLCQEKIRLEARLYHSEKMETVGRLAGGIAHDFNNLLTAIIGNATMATGAPSGSPEISHALEDIVKAGDKAARLTRQLLAFSRKQIIEPRPVDLNKALGDLDRIMGRILHSDATLVWDLSEEVGHVMVDPGQLEQVVINLVVNAGYAISTGGSIIIGTRVPGSSHHARPEECAYEVEGDFYEFFVRDDGCGMDQETLSRIFEPFFTTRKTGEGTGLGLSTVFGIVRQHMGHVLVTSAPGEGSVFRVLLPRAVRECGSGTQKADDKANPGGTEAVLLVEDDEMVRTIAEKTLASLGYKVLCASDGQQALDLSTGFKGTIHLLLVDVVIPDMGGAALAERLRESRPGIKVLFTSGYSGEIISKQGVLEQGNHFIGKPYSTAELANRIRTVLEEK
ncbi:MAG: ATP-binding protein [Candidatus Fermentibacteraceae bacterium]